MELTNREFELLEYLMRNERLVVSRERLLDDVWGYDPMAATNTIDVFISNLRRKLEAGGEPRLLHTKRGAGYVSRTEVAAARQAGRLVARRRCGPSSWPVRWRLAAVSAGLTLAILLVFGAVIGQLATSRIRDDFNREVSGAAQTLAGEFRIVYTPLGTISGKSGPELDDFVRPDDASARIFDVNGNLIDQSSDAHYLGPIGVGLADHGEMRVATARNPRRHGIHHRLRPVRPQPRPRRLDRRSPLAFHRRRHRSAARCSPASPASRSPPARCGRSRR